MGKVLLLKNVRLSFPVLGAPEEYKTGDGKPRWSATGLVRVDDPQCKLVAAALLECATEKWGAKAKAHFDNIMSDSKLCCWQPGTRKPDYDGYEGCYSLSAHRQRKDGPPLVMLRNRAHVYYRGDPKAVPEGVNPSACVLNQEFPGMEGKVYSGCYVNLQVDFWAQDNTNGKALRATLMGVQFWGDGDAFSGGRAPDQDAFPEMSEGADADDLTA